jgi:hypothetical protein
MEEEVQVTKGKKKSKKYDDTGAATVVDESVPTAEGEAVAVVEKAAGAPRPRRFEYGIVNENTIVKAVEDPRVAKEIQAAWDALANVSTVGEFFDVYGPDRRTEARHALRVMSRRGLINITSEDGTVYPLEYVAEEPAAEPEVPAETA